MHQTHTVLVHEIDHSMIIRMNRQDQQNAISTQMMHEIHLALNTAEKNSECKTIVLEGHPGVFSIGMDFKETSKIIESDASSIKSWTSLYMSTLNRLATIPKITIAKVDGKVLAGGVGLAAACDLVLATERTTFALSEVLWGLMPAMVTPYLVRRIGFQQAYKMTLATETLTAKEAFAIQLVDELTRDIEETVKYFIKRMDRLEVETIQNVKKYFRKQWLITDLIEKEAVEEITELLQDQKVRAKIKNFVENRVLPWEKKENLKPVDVSHAKDLIEVKEHTQKMRQDNKGEGL